ESQPGLQQQLNLRLSWLRIERSTNEEVWNAFREPILGGPCLRCYGSTPAAGGREGGACLQLAQSGGSAGFARSVQGQVDRTLFLSYGFFLRLHGGSAQFSA